MSETELGEIPAKTRKISFGSASASRTKTASRAMPMTELIPEQDNTVVLEDPTEAAIPVDQVDEQDRIIDDSAVENRGRIIENPLQPDGDAQLKTGDESLSSLSVEELKRKQQEIARQIEERQREEKAAVIQQILDVAKTYHVTIDELIEAFGGFKPKRKGVKAQIKYRDPATGVTWSGRGKEPTWMRGQDRNKFLIKD